MIWAPHAAPPLPTSNPCDTIKVSPPETRSSMSAPPPPPPAPPPRNTRRTRLPNGLLVLTESIPHVRSVSMGVWIDSGSRDESLAQNGISHFVEHMVDRQNVV